MVSALILITVLAQSAAESQMKPPLPAGHPSVAAVYVPQRVFDTRRKAFTDFESMLADLARADVVLVGEQHDDSNTHRLEGAVLQGLLRRRVSVTLSLEMFERDVQSHLDAFLAGSMTEEDFLQKSRPWPRYATDYRPLVELARAHGWKVVAANVPRRLAADVSKGGTPALDKLSAEDRALGARDLQCPLDAYYTRFADTMSDHAGTGDKTTTPEQQRETVERYYFAQCLKDETMAESIATAFERQAGRPGTIVHYTGAFHMDFGEGTAARVARRLPGRRVALVSMLPVEDLDGLAPDDDDFKRAEYLVYTVK
jgi:uncharacterized iron-regulated protein